MVDGIRKAPIEQAENGLIHALAQTTHEVAKASLAASAESESLTSIFLRWRRDSCVSAADFCQQFFLAYFAALLNQIGLCEPFAYLRYLCKILSDKLWEHGGWCDR